LETKKTTFYINTELHAAVRIAAFKQGITLTKFVESALIDKLKKEGFECPDVEPEKEQS